jgi:hypothetical protein
MPRSEKLELAYRSFRDSFNLPAPHEGLESIIDEMGGREGLQSLLGNTPVHDVINMVSSADRGLQLVVDQLSEEVELAIKKFGFPPLNADFYAGEFPTGSFNAQACVVSDGILILLNTGLMIFVHKVSKLIMQTLNFADDVKNPRDSFAAVAGAMSYEEEVDAFAELILGYLSSEQGWFQRVRRIPAVTSKRAARLHGQVVNSVEKFVLAHEYGHAIAGHLSIPRTMTSRTPVGDVELAYKSQAEEFEADRIAALLLMSNAPREIRTRAQLFDVQCDIVGPFLFFALDELITRVRREITGLAVASIVTDHPPSQKRMQAVRAYYHGLAGFEVTEIGDVYAKWVAKVGDDVVKGIARRTSTSSDKRAKRSAMSQLRNLFSPRRWLKPSMGLSQRGVQIAEHGLPALSGEHPTKQSCASDSRSAIEKLNAYLHEYDISEASIVAELINHLLREPIAFDNGVPPHRIEDKAAAIIELTRRSSALCKLFFECEIFPSALRIAIPLTPSQLKYVCLKVGFEQTAATAMSLKGPNKSGYVAMSEGYLNAIGSRDCDDAFKKVINILEHDPKSCIDRFLRDRRMRGMQAVHNLINKKQVLEMPAGMERVPYTDYKGTWFVDKRLDAKETAKALSCLACRELMVPDDLIDDFLLQLEIDGRSR